MAAIDVKLLPAYFEQYNWVKHHGVYGYPADTFPTFRWVKSLEERGAWFVSKADLKDAPTHFLRELLDWGGGAGPRMKFEAGLGNVSLLERIQKVVANIENPTLAIQHAMRLPGFGLTYGSKLLRFLDGDRHASLDSRIRGALLAEGLLARITDASTPSRISGYVSFLGLISKLTSGLEQAGIDRPDCDLPRGKSPTGWRVADVEMALFAWAEHSQQKPRKRSITP